MHVMLRKYSEENGVISSYKKATQIFYFMFFTDNLDKVKKLIQLLETLLAPDESVLKEEAPWLISEV